MKTCRDFESLLSLFSNNELAAEPRAAVASHLVNCAACRQKIEDYHELKKYLFKLPTPELPENLFADFHQGVLDKIARSKAIQNQRLGFFAIVYALYRRQRFIIAVTTLLMLIALPTWLAHHRNSRSAPRSSLTQLLERRDWTGLYYAMLDGNSRIRLLNEPVPAQLLNAALAELIKTQRDDKKIRLGLQQILSKIKTREGNVLSLRRSVQILGRISATGYEPAPRSKQSIWNPENSLLVLQRIDQNKAVTINTLLLGNSL